MILVFSSSRCPHCPKAVRAVKKVAPEYADKGVSYRKIRSKTPEGKKLALRYGVRSLPTILLLDDEGGELKRIVGAVETHQLRSKLEGVLNPRKTLRDVLGSLIR